MDLLHTMQVLAAGIPGKQIRCGIDSELKGIALVRPPRNCQACPLLLRWLVLVF